MPLPGYVEKIASFDVEKKEIPRPGGAAFLKLSETPSGCLHTTEGHDIDSAWNTNRNDPDGSFGPHFYVGENRIIQARPLWAQASSLLGGEPNHHFVQVEAVYRIADLKPTIAPHLTKPGTIEPLLAVMSFLRDRLGIPLWRPPEWPDDLTKDDPKSANGAWAVEDNYRRRSGLAMKRRGWFNHLEVPGNTHYDAGSFGFAEAFQMIEEGVDVALTEEQEKTLKAAKAFLDELRATLGSKPNESEEARAKGAGSRVAKAVLKAEGK
jgi:hypothetical protein